MELAKKIQAIRDGIKELLQIYLTNQRNIEDMDAMTQDILHQIELGSYNEGRKYYGQLRKARKARRESKDVEEVLSKFYSLISSDNGIKFIRQLDEVLGDARNQEKKLQNRHYNAKYIQNLPISRDIVD